MSLNDFIDGQLVARNRVRNTDLHAADKIQSWIDYAENLKRQLAEAQAARRSDAVMIHTLTKSMEEVGQQLVTTKAELAREKAHNTTCTKF